MGDKSKALDFFDPMVHKLKGGNFMLGNRKGLLFFGVFVVLMFCFSLLPQIVHAEVYRVAGNWNQTGTGTIEGESYYDSGTFTIESYIDSTGLEWVTRFSAAGNYSLGGVNYPYNYSITENDLGGPVAVIDNHMTMVLDGITYDLTLLSPDDLILTMKGTETSTGRYFDLEYDANRANSIDTGGSGGGGGCNITAFPVMSVLLLAPLFVLFKK